VCLNSDGRYPCPFETNKENAVVAVRETHGKLQEFLSEKKYGDDFDLRPKMDIEKLHEYLEEKEIEVEKEAELREKFRLAVVGRTVCKQIVLPEIK